jgi:hypothetical protein
MRSPVITISASFIRPEHWGHLKLPLQFEGNLTLAPTAEEGFIEKNQ